MVRHALKMAKRPNTSTKKSFPCRILHIKSRREDVCKDSSLTVAMLDTNLLSESGRVQSQVLSYEWYQHMNTVSMFAMFASSLNQLKFEIAT